MEIQFAAARGSLPRTEEVLTHLVYGQTVRDRLCEVARRLGFKLTEYRGLGDLAICLIDPLIGILVVDYYTGLVNKPLCQLEIFLGSGAAQLKELDGRIAELLSQFPFQPITNLVKMVRQAQQAPSVIRDEIKGGQPPQCLGSRRELVAV